MYPGNYQPLQAVAALLTDILEQPSSNEASTSRQLIDKVFSLLGDDSGVVAEQNGRMQQRRLSQSGKQAWTMLSHLRRRAWRSMGVDPAVLWTSARSPMHSSSDNQSSLDSGQPGAAMHGMPTDTSHDYLSAPADTISSSQAESTGDLFAMMLDEELGEDLFSNDADPFDIPDWMR